MSHLNNEFLSNRQTAKADWAEHAQKQKTSLPHRPYVVWHSAQIMLYLNRRSGATSDVIAMQITKSHIHNLKHSVLSNVRCSHIRFICIFITSTISEMYIVSTNIYQTFASNLMHNFDYFQVVKTEPSHYSLPAGCDNSLVNISMFIE
jgi:hypothetical protein